MNTDRAPEYRGSKKHVVVYALTVLIACPHCGSSILNEHSQDTAFTLEELEDVAQDQTVACEACDEAYSMSIGERARLDREIA